MLGGHARGLRHAREGLQGAGRRDQPRRRGPFARPVAQAGREGHEIEDVIGVQVRDHDRVDRGVVRMAAQLGEHPRPAVEQHDLAATLDEVAGAGAVGVLPGGGLPEDRDAHWLADPIVRPGARAAPRRARRGDRADEDPDLGLVDERSSVEGELGDEQRHGEADPAERGERRQLPRA